MIRIKTEVSYSYQESNSQITFSKYLDQSLSSLETIIMQRLVERNMYYTASMLI